MSNDTQRNQKQAMTATGIVKEGRLLRMSYVALCMAMIILCMTVAAHAIAPGVATSLTVAPRNSVNAGTVLTLTAAVSSEGGQTTGSVSFCDLNTGCNPSSLLGTAQLNSNGVATLKLVLGVGNYNIQAIYFGTQHIPAGQSTPQVVTVEQDSSYPSSTVFSASGSPTAYNLTATVSAFGRTPPAGTVWFADATNRNALVASAPVNPATAKTSFVAPSSTIAVGHGSYVSAVGDFNNDGLLDLAVANSADSTVSVALGKGNGSFAAATNYATGNAPAALAVGDFNADGYQDLAVVNSGAASVSVLLGNGDGTFQSQTSYAVGHSPSSVAISDVNLDGFLDLVVVNSADNSVSVLFGNGNGTFQPQVSYPTGANPQQAIVADVNQDGWPDIITANKLDNSVSVLLNNADGTFASAMSDETGNHPQSLSAADLNGDGILDLVVANYSDGTISVLLGNGDGTFQSQSTFSVGKGPYQNTVADFNYDGFLDVAVANASGNTVSVLLGRGDGTFQAQTTYAAGTTPAGLVSADFNGDGLVDLAVTDAANGTTGTVSVLLGQQVVQVSAPNVRVIGNGLQSMVAMYAGDGGRAASLSSALPLPGVALASSTSLTTSANPAMSTQTLKLLAQVSSSSGTPTGSVTFYDGANKLGTAALSSSSQAALSVALNPGNHSISAVYSGDSNFAASTSKVFSQDVERGLSDTTLAISAASVIFEKPVILTALVTPSPNGTPAGTVTFTLGSTVLASVPVASDGRAVLATSALPCGADKITASYSGNTELVPSTSQSVVIDVMLPTFPTLATYR